MTDEQQQQHPTFHIHNDEPIIVDADNRALQIVGQTLPAAIPDLFEKLDVLSDQNGDVLNQLIGQVFDTPDILEQTGHVQRLMQGLYKNSRWASTRLGQIITIARERMLYKHAGHNRMDAWIQDCGIDLNMALKAEQLFANVGWFREINLPYQTVVEANLVQIQEIAAIKAEISTAIAQRVSTELPKTASPEQRQKRYQELQNEQLPDIQARVQTVLNSPTEGELIQTITNRRSGTAMKACLFIRVTINPRTREVTGTWTLPLGDDVAQDTDDEEEMFDSKERNVFSNISNGFQVKFFVEGEDDPVSYIDLPEKVRDLLERKSTPSSAYMQRQRQRQQQQANTPLSTRHIDDRDYGSSYGDGDDDNYI